MDTQEKPMISVEEAYARIMPHFQVLEPEEVDILDALDRVLVDNIRAEADIPPFRNSAMDGYAVRSEDVRHAGAETPVQLSVVGNLAAGYVSGVIVGPGCALRIMTGAPMPDGADAVVRFEDTSEALRHGRSSGEQSDDLVGIFVPVRAGENTRARGEDVQRGEIVLHKGMVVRPAEIGVLAALGFGRVRVVRRPRVAVLATGDELLTIDQPLQPGKIRNANEYSVSALVLKYGGVPVRLGIARDSVEELTAKVREGIAQRVDLFLTSAGVSVGDYDVVKEVLASEGKMDFWQVRMKPGKPLAFGTVGGVPLMGLPGNPVSSMVSFEQFARPAILKMLGRTKLIKPTVAALLERDVQNGARRGFIRVVLTKREHGWTARSTGEQGSGVLTSMSKANGLAIIPEGQLVARAGEQVQVQVLDWSEQE